MTDLRPRTRRSPSPKGIARHGQLKKGGPLPTLFAIVGASLVVLLVSAGGVAGISAMNVANKIVDGSVDIGEVGDAPPPAIGALKGGFNVLIVGSDQCEEWDGCQGPGDRGSGKLNDVTMLLHVSEDQTNAVAVSFPRDLIVPIPSCKREDGNGDTAAMAAQQINVTLSDGGLPCTVKTVEALTGLDIQYAGLITFKGVIAMTNAIGGVKVCVTGNLDDDYAKIHLTEGSHTLKGAEALAFLRSRHGIGDGSDITRISSQQTYLTSLVRKLQSKGTLGNPTTVYKLANAAAENMQLSTSLASLDTMYSMALALKDIPLDSITFVQYPSRLNVPGPYEQKALPDVAKATQLFDLIKADEPFTLVNNGESGGSTKDPNAKDDDYKSSTSSPSTSSPSSSSTSTPKPTKTSTADEQSIDVPGVTSDQKTCSVTNN